MTSILMRAHKDPFHVASPRETLRRNLIGENSGNLLFSHAAHKLLGTRGTRITTGTLQTGREDAARINAEHDHVVLPLANAFRPSFREHLDALSALLERLTVPVTVLGIGAQLRLDGDPARLKGMRASTERFVRAVLDRSPSIGVRGEFTRDYLVGLGFRDVEVIGCPSLFLHGRDLVVRKRAASIGPDSAVTMTLSPYLEAMGPVVERHVARYSRLHYVAQNREALRMLLGRGRRVPVDPGSASLPVHPRHPLLASGRTRFFVDPAPWLAFLAGQDFVFGTRIHGTIAALLAGTPATLLAHDSRTLELAMYHDLPHRTLDRVRPTTDAADLYDEADFAAMHAGHAERFDRMAAFLAAHGLRHVFEPGEDPAAFDRAVARTAYPDGVTGRRRLPAGLDLVERLVPPTRRRSAPAAAA